LNLVSILIFLFVEISFILIFRGYLLLKLISWVYVKQKDTWQNWSGKNWGQCRFFTNFTFYLNFLEHFWYDSYYADIFPRFSLIFRVCVNFFGIFGTVWIFLW